MSNEEQILNGFAEMMKGLCGNENLEVPDLKLKSVTPQDSCEDCISRQAVMNCFKKWQPYMATRLFGFEKELSSLPPVTPQLKIGHWVLADEQNKEDVDNDNYRFICSECQCSDIHAKDTKVPYCWKCGARMVESEVKE
jgi:hypothetical protein